jgi:hypothetical protein
MKNYFRSKLPKKICLLFLLFLSASNTQAQWVQMGSDIDGESAGDESGSAVSLSADGHTIAIGAYLNDGTGVESGHARVYNWNGSSWLQKGGDIDGEAAGDQSGVALSLSPDGNTLAIGAFKNIGFAGGWGGHVRIYDWNGITWIQRGIDLNGYLNVDLAGYSVSLSADANTVAFGTPYDDDSPPVMVDDGNTRVYHWNGSA